jgi:hypothetical protein
LSRGFAFFALPWLSLFAFDLATFATRAEEGRAGLTQTAKICAVSLVHIVALRFATFWFLAIPDPHFHSI